MMSLTVSGRLKVDQFFRDYNWLGLPPKLDATQTKPESLEQPSWLCHSVEEFFKHNNWRGESNPSSLSRDISIASTSLIMPVGQFFQLAVWGGCAIAGVVSKPQSQPSAFVYNSQEYNISDLSDLF